MKKELDYPMSYCCVTWNINWVSIDSNDFWDQYDDDIDNAEPYWCWNMIFKWREAIESILNKYNITKDEYLDIVSELENKLSFGCCSLCV